MSDISAQAASAGHRALRAPADRSRAIALALGIIGVITLTGMIGVLALRREEAPTSLVLATTTSARDTGLLDHLVPLVRESLRIEMRYVAVGSGQALEYGRRCDADVLMTHSPAAEQAFMDQGYGDSRKEVFYNEYVLVGPESDPAGLHGTHNGTAALRLIHDFGARFATRGDSSGTHVAEQRLWAQAGFDYSTEINVPSNSWYVNVSAGMLVTMQRAAELEAYTLADTGTWYAKEGSLDLALHVDGDPRLFNQYSVVTLSEAKCPGVAHGAARAFQEWIASSAGQEAVGKFEVNGRQLFHPNAKP